MPPIYCELNQHSKSDTSNNSNFIGFTLGIAMSPQAQDRSGEKQKSSCLRSWELNEGEQEFNALVITTDLSPGSRQ